MSSARRGTNNMSSGRDMVAVGRRRLNRGGIQVCFGPGFRELRKAIVRLSGTILTSCGIVLVLVLASSSKKRWAKPRVNAAPMTLRMTPLIPSLMPPLTSSLSRYLAAVKLPNLTPHSNHVDITGARVHRCHSGLRLLDVSNRQVA